MKNRGRDDCGLRIPDCGLARPGEAERAGLTRGRRTWPLVLAGAAWACLACVAHAQPASAPLDPKQRPTGPTPSCTVSGCHADVRKFPVQHGPVAANTCDACHKLAEPAAHKFEMMRQKADLCYFCHDAFKARYLHKPVEQGDCLNCHSPHGGETRQFLKSATVAATCASCHKDVTRGKPTIHGPVAAGACVACHNPHKSEHKGLLLRAGKELCLECHASMETRLTSAVSTHEPVRTDCLRCHTPHSSDEAMMLQAEPEALCFSCHQDIKGTVEHAKTAHGAIVMGRKCLNCHEPHATGFARILRNNPMALCLDCHNKELDTPRGKIANMAVVLAGGKSLHGPIAQKNCAACHQIHGGSNFRLLMKEYPPEFYASFKEESYALCFSCHERALVHDARTTTLTGFRNGDVNLHYLHVNKDTKGRTCRACHETHASDNAKHIRDSVPFGKWNMPINFKKTSTGGGCAPGCHNAYEYDRDRPATNPASNKPATWPMEKGGQP